jgi:chromosome segregation ATPase
MRPAAPKGKTRRKPWGTLARGFKPLNGSRAGFIIAPMSEETTHNLPDRRSFEERVFARFDAIDAGLRDLNVRMESLETRVQRLEDESARRSVETKPIWERALAEITAVRQDVAALSEKVDALSEKVDALDRKVTVLSRDVLTVRADQVKLEDRMDRLETKPAS